MGSVWKQIFSISFIGPLISFHFIHFTPPGVTSERRLARSTRRYIGTALRGALYSLSDLSPYCFIIIVRLMPIYKVYTIGQTWSGPVLYTLYIGINLTIIMKQYGDRQTDRQTDTH